MAVPAIGKLPFPPAILSLISPPLPVAAPLKGSHRSREVVGFSLEAYDTFFVCHGKEVRFVCRARWNISISGPSINAQLSL